MDADLPESIDTVDTLRKVLEIALEQLTPYPACFLWVVQGSRLDLEMSVSTSVSA